jgi:hypothetical protein
MRHQDDRQRWHAQALGFVAAKLAELISADHDCWQAVHFHLDGVVDTPRRTGASIPRANKYHITAHHKVCEQLVSGAYSGMGLAPMHDLRSTVLFTEQMRQPQHEHVSVRLGIVQNADPCATESRVSRRQGLDVLGSFGSRIEQTNEAWGMGHLRFSLQYIRSR